MSLILSHFSKPVLGSLTAQTLRQVQLGSSVIRSLGSVSGCVRFSLPPVSQPRAPLLSPASPLMAVRAGIKHVAHPNKRCRHCYFQIKDEQLFVMCTANPKHYNAVRQKNKKWGNYVFTHATTGSSDQGRGRGSRHMKTQQSFRLDY